MLPRAYPVSVTLATLVMTAASYAATSTDSSVQLEINVLQILDAPRA